jgi:hypothetical protein
VKYGALFRTLTKKIYVLLAPALSVKVRVKSINKFNRDYDVGENVRTFDEYVTKERRVHEIAILYPSSSTITGRV